VYQISRPKDLPKKRYSKSINMCSCELSQLPTLPTSQGLNSSFWPWIFFHKITSISIICLPNFKFKRFTPEKIFEIYQHVLLQGTISLLPTLTPSQGLKFLFLPWIFLKDNLYVDNMYTKFQVQKIHTKKDIWNLPICISKLVIVKSSLTTTHVGRFKISIFVWIF